MTKNSLHTFIERVRAIWGPLTTELVAACRDQLAELCQASDDEAWLAALHREAPAARELYRDPIHGFVLLAHVEPHALYRPPHDHGRGWVIYAVQRGASEMATYARVDDRLVQRDAAIMHPGQVRVFLPGDIHDTRCTSGPALLFRFTDRDLRIEDTEARRVKRYVERDGRWTDGAA